ncbi:DUF805 domain-containing protein [Ochrobactrum tritici]|uniref:DUF805 domain-containing protein n=1 Tax=Brucella tritici TaxID=94626 RepID=A0A7X6FRR1_9HYPH|nr:DUF805 domain-containing protein [Brucella tritici]
MRQYAVFSGRATRSQYWLFSLVLFGMLIIALMMDQVLAIRPLMSLRGNYRLGVFGPPGSVDRCWRSSPA